MSTSYQRVLQGLMYVTSSVNITLPINPSVRNDNANEKSIHAQNRHQYHIAMNNSHANSKQSHPEHQLNAASRRNSR